MEMCRNCHQTIFGVNAKSGSIYYHTATGRAECGTGTYAQPAALPDPELEAWLLEETLAGRR